MKRVHKNLITAAVLLALGGGAAIYVWKSEVTDAPDRKRREGEERRLFVFGRDQVERGRIYARGATIAFQRDPEWGWKLTSPIEGPADRTAIDTAIDRMAALRADPVEGAPAGAEAMRTYELDRPEAWIAVETSRGNFELVVGPKNAIDERRFVTDGKRERVYSAESSFAWSVDRPLEALREHRIFPFAREKITAVTMSAREGVEWELRSTEEGWVVADDKGATLPADEGEVGLLLVSLTGRLKAEHFLSDEYRELTDYVRRVEITTADGRVVRARFGDYSETGAEGSAVPVVWVEGTTSLIQVPDWVRKDFAKGVSTLRDRTIARFEREEARRIEWWQAGKMIAAVERSSDAAEWIVVGSGKSAQQWLPNSTLLSLSRFKADRVEKEHPSKDELIDWQLDPYRRRIVVIGEGAKTIADVRLGKSAGEGAIRVMELGRRRVGRYGTKLEELWPETWR